MVSTSDFGSDSPGSSPGTSTIIMAGFDQPFLSIVIDTIKF